MITLTTYIKQVIKYLLHSLGLRLHVMQSNSLATTTAAILVHNEIVSSSDTHTHADVLLGGRLVIRVQKLGNFQGCQSGQYASKYLTLHDIVAHNAYVENAKLLDSDYQTTFKQGVTIHWTGLLDSKFNHKISFPCSHNGCLNSVEQWNGMERNGMSAALATHVLQPTDDLILNCTSHLSL